MESNKHNSTRVAFSEKIAKFTPDPSQDAPNGLGFPGQTLILNSPGFSAPESLYFSKAASGPRGKRQWLGLKRASKDVMNQISRRASVWDCNVCRNRLQFVVGIEI
jgi:hypothetical protein